MADPGVNSHPVDALIRELIVTEREASSGDVAQIMAHIAAAPFDPRIDARVLQKDRGLSYQGTTLTDRVSALLYHLIIRVVGDRQWADGTTIDEYVRDLHDAVRASDARLVVYRWRGGHVATVVARNNIDRIRLGEMALPWVLIVYSADRGTIITGYQLSTDAPTNIPEDARWLK